MVKKLRKTAGLTISFLINALVAATSCAATPVYPPEAVFHNVDAEGETTPPAKSAKALPPYATPRPAALDTKRLVIALSAQKINFDFRASFLASEAEIFTGLYEGLFSYHPFTMEPVPAVASSWEVSEDKKQWTFHLKRMAKYSNGDTVRAADFRAAWLSLLEPERASPYSSLFDVIEGAQAYRTGENDDPDSVGVTAKDDRTLVVKLNAPAAFFPAMLCHHSFSPIHPSLLAAKEWSAANLVSNGPYRLSSSSASGIVLEKNNNYWDKDVVSLDKITFQFTGDGGGDAAGGAVEAADLWNTGKALWISGDVDLDKVTDRSGITVNAMFATHYYYIRSGAAPWNDAKIRKALCLALPWEEIRSTSYIPASTLIYPVRGYPEIKGLDTTDMEAAKKLLSEAGHEKGSGLPPLRVRVTPSQEAARVALIMKTAWEDGLGILVKIETLKFDEYFDSLKDSGYDVASTTWIGDFPDPYTFLQMWRKDSNLNDAHYSDADFENLINRSMGEEGETRLATLSEAEELLLDRGAVLPIAYSPALNVVDLTELDGWYENILDIHPLKYISYKKSAPLPGIVRFEGSPNRGLTKKTLFANMK